VVFLLNLFHPHRKYLKEPCLINKVDCASLLSLINFGVPTYNTRSHSPFLIHFFSLNYGSNNPFDEACQ